MSDRFERRTTRWLGKKPRIQTEVRVSILSDRAIDRYELERLIGRRFPAFSLTDPTHREWPHG